MASPIISSGLASGMDTQSLIAQLVSIQRIPIQKLQQAAAQISSKATKLGALTTKLNTLKSAAEELDSATKLLSYTAKSSDESVLTMSASGDAVPGKFKFTVSSLASAEKDLSNGFSSSSSQATVAGGTLSIATNGGTAVDITIDAGASLADIASAINGADAGVTATILNDGAGTATSYRLLLAAKDTGYTTGTASNAVTVLSGVSELTISESETATNATFTLDSDPTVYSRTTNSFSDLLTGMTFSLKDTGTSTVEIATDPEAVRTKVQSFVDAYNAVVNQVTGELTPSKSTSRATSLAGEPYMRSLDAALDSVAGTTVGTGGLFERLSDLGISIGNNGALTLDAAKFDAALAKDPGSVSAVFTTDSTGIVAAVSAMVDRFTDSVDGILTSGKKALDAQSTRITSRIETLDYRSTLYEERLRRQYTAMEQAIAAAQSQGSQFSASIAG